MIYSFIQPTHQQSNNSSHSITLQVPLAEIRSLGLAGTDPVLMLAGPIPATEMALKKAGMDMQDIDLFEVRHLSSFFLKVYW